VYFLSAIVVDDEEFDWITLFFVCVDMEAFWPSWVCVWNVFRLLLSVSLSKRFLNC
jgi:hypothetical protein